MKKLQILLFSLILSCLLVENTVAQAVTPVDSRNVRYQMEREVITRWNRFNPGWYFLLFHNQYRRGEDRRNMLQLAPTLAFIKINEEAAEIEQEDVNTVFENELFLAADRSLNKNYHLFYEPKIKNLNTEINLANAEAMKIGVAPEHILALMQERERINADIDLTKDAYQDDSKKAEQFRVALKDLAALRGYYRRIINLYKSRDNLLTN